MKLLFKILKIITASIVALTIILFISSLAMQNKVAGIILKSLNDKLLTKYEFESVRLSFLRNFPKASLDLKDVLVHSSPGFDTSCFIGINTDTLLSAKSVTMDFKITDIIKGIYNIERIGIKEGRLNLFTDTAGLVNYEITATDETVPEEDKFTINLEKINLSGLNAIYNNRATRLLIEGYAESGQLKSRISGNDIDFSADGTLLIDKFQLYNFSMTNTVEADVDINLNSTSKGIFFNKSNIDIDNLNFELSGFISTDNVLDLALTGKNIDISGIKNYIPDKHRDKISAYDPVGILNINGRFTGPVTRTANPLIEINFMLEKGNVTYKNSAIKLHNLSFKGFYTNGPEMVPETSYLAISNFEVGLGSAIYTGSLKLSDFTSLYGSLNLAGKIFPSEIKEFFNLKDVSTAGGVADFDIRMAGKIPRKSKYTISDFFSFNPEGNLDFKSLSIGFQNDKVMFSNVTGYFQISNSAVARDLKFTCKDQEFELDCKFKRFNEWLSGKPVTLQVSADITCDRFVPESFFPKSAASDASSAGNKRAPSLPEDLIIDLNFQINDLIYKNFLAEDIIGNVSYQPLIFNFKTLKLNSLDGVISGNGFIAQNTDKSFIGKGNFDLDRININKTFTSFHNFGQNFIKAENLDGILSGSLSLLIPMDSLLKPVKKSITAEGKYTLVKGALIEFEPIKELSSFISLSELSNIHFEELQNDFFIRSNYLYIPQMEVKSSAADLSVSGKHDFDNNYEYHIKILLSEMLSKKIKKPRPNTTEFGAIKDDGLGRTSLLLKIRNQGEDLKVSYDIAAAGNQIKNDIKSERQSLKNILNEEYGWFRNDSSVSEKPARKSPRFKVTWDEIDTAKIKEDQPAEQKENLLKNLLKKK